MCEKSMETVGNVVLPEIVYCYGFNVINKTMFTTVWDDAKQLYTHKPGTKTNVIDTVAKQYSLSVSI